MKQKNVRRSLLPGGVLLLTFGLWTLAVRIADVQPIGPEGSSVGFAVLNGAVHKTVGVHMSLYALTDWLGLVPVGVMLCFAFLGLWQLVRRKDIRKVDRDVLLLGGFYLLVAAAYLLFEIYPVNFRPVLIEGRLEASYPSSTTLLVLTVMPALSMQVSWRMKNGQVKRAAQWGIWLFTAFMVLGRLISGVHWLTDILGGALLSAGLVLLYRGAVFGGKK